MANIPIPVAGPTYTSRSLPVSSQLTQNFYIEIGRESENQATLQPFPGLLSFATAGAGADRGMCEFDGVLYKVSGNYLYSISSNGTATQIGFIEGSGYCCLRSVFSHLVIATGEGKPYSYDGTTLTQGADADLTSSATVAYINNRSVYDGDEADVIFSDLSAPLSVDSANITASDVNPDDTLAVYSWRQQVMVFGGESITPYYNSGTGSPPFDVIQNSVQEIGISAIHSIASNNNALYFLGSDKRVYAITGLQPQPVDNPAISNEIAGYAGVSDGIGMCLTLNGNNFYLLTFPSNGSWLFNESSGWTKLSFGTDGAPSLINSYCYIYGKHLVGDRRNGNVYELDLETFTDNGTTIIRQRDTVKISGKDLGVPGKELFQSKLELIIETGVGIANGQGSDPQLMMSYSDDGGRTWSAEQWASMGAMGDFTKRLEWFDLGSFYERMFRFKVSDPVKTVFISASAEVMVGP
jgi:hypothetical protein